MSSGIGFAFEPYGGLKTTTGGGTTGTRYTINSGKQLITLCDNLRAQNYPKSILNFGSNIDLGKEERAILPSNCTIDGKGKAFKGGFYINNRTNIIIKNVCFDEIKLGAVDSITIKDGSHHIWVDHCTFTKTEDGLCDIIDESTHITVSWCTFGKRHGKCMLIGASDKKTSDRGKLKVTLHNNWFKSHSRSPRVRYGTVHIFNNYYDVNHGDFFYAIKSVLGAKVFVEKNYFVFNKDKKKGMIMRDGSDSKDESNGTIYSRQNYGISTKFDNKWDSSHLPYTYKSIPASQVKESVMKHSGCGGKTAVHSAGVRFLLIEWQRDILNFFDTILYEKFPPYKKLYDTIGREGIFTIIALIVFIISYSAINRRYMRQKAINTYNYMNRLRRRRRALSSKSKSKSSNSENQIVIEVHNPIVPSADTSAQNTSSATSSNPSVPSATSSSTPSMTPPSASTPSTTPSASTPS